MARSASIKEPGNVLTELAVNWDLLSSKEPDVAVKLAGKRHAIQRGQHELVQYVAALHQLTKGYVEAFVTGKLKGQIVCPGPVRCRQRCQDALGHAVGGFPNEFLKRTG